MTRSLLLLIASSVLPAQAAEPIPADAARAVFDEAQALCERDAGRLWGHSLCVPMMLVDPASRTLVASVGDADGLLEARDGVFVGRLPEDQTIANTAIDWSGTRWTQLIWPLPASDERRAVLIVHESLHTVQPALGWTLPQAGDNVHLDQTDGRYWLQLEWRALADALQASEEQVRRGAVFDALVFRHQRWLVAADAERNETALELNEGLAEYTGVMVAGRSEEDRIRAALHDLRVHVGDSSFVRSFAYATGPAYGLLLDRYAPGWRLRLDGTRSLPDLLGQATGFERGMPDPYLEARVARHDVGHALRTSEAAREQARLARLARNRARFVDGPVLRLGLREMRVQFDPRTLQPLDELGTVYPQLQIVDVWGRLQAEDGALMASDWSAVVVAGPVQGGGAAVRGEGWTLELAPGWTLVPGPRAGDLVLEKAAP